MMSLKVNGITYDGFTSAVAKKSIREVSGNFAFQATSSETKDFPITRMAEIEVYIDSDLIMAGFVDIITVDYSKGAHTLNIAGRSKTSVLIDSSVPGNRRFNSPIDLAQVASTIIQRLGSDIKVVNNVAALKKFETPLEAKVSQTAYQFLEEHARKSNVMLTSNAEGDLVIYQSNPEKIETILLHQKGNIENNVLEASIKFDDSKRFSSYTVYSQKGDGEGISNKNQASTVGIAKDTGALSVKQKIMVLESEGSIQDASNRAAWEANVRRAKATSHIYTVQGFYHSEGLWDINQITRVVDDYATIDDDMLIDSVEYKYSINQGSLTKLGVVGPDAYQVKASISLVEEALGSLTWKL